MCIAREMIGVEYGVCSNQASRAHPTGKEEKYMQPTKGGAHASRSPDRIREVYAAKGCAHASQFLDSAFQNPNLNVKKCSPLALISVDDSSYLLVFTYGLYLSTL